MLTSRNSPHPSPGCVAILTKLLLRQQKSYEAFDFVDVSESLSLLFRSLPFVGLTHSLTQLL
jgi:hypothetical protein